MERHMMLTEDFHEQNYYYFESMLMLILILWLIKWLVTVSPGIVSV